MSEEEDESLENMVHSKVISFEECLDSMTEGIQNIIKTLPNYLEKIHDNYLEIPELIRCYIGVLNELNEKVKVRNDLVLAGKENVTCLLTLTGVTALRNDIYKQLKETDGDEKQYYN